jgi:hypothetical protein
MPSTRSQSASAAAWSLLASSRVTIEEEVMRDAGFEPATSCV